MVGMTPSRSAPASWSLAPRAMALILPTSSITRRACSTTAWPRAVRSTSFLLRSKSLKPSSSSSFARARESVGWVTKHFCAARPKWRSWASATTYLSSVRVMKAVGGQRWAAIGSLNRKYNHNQLDLTILPQYPCVYPQSTHTEGDPHVVPQFRRQARPAGEVPHPRQRAVEGRDDQRPLQ